ncbi:unnamed protein product [[Actinomadura] parvosata subsp. kistnae]|nr:unnamed protein product [Actinomadura parvosata subsp. kistnae]
MSVLSPPGSSSGSYERETRPAHVLLTASPVRGGGGIGGAPYWAAIYPVLHISCRGPAVRRRSSSRWARESARRDVR